LHHITSASGTCHKSKLKNKTEGGSLPKRNLDSNSKNTRACAFWTFLSLCIRPRPWSDVHLPTDGRTVQQGSSNDAFTSLPRRLFTSQIPNAGDLCFATWVRRRHVSARSRPLRRAGAVPSGTALASRKRDARRPAPHPGGRTQLSFARSAVR
jgi:hypothetical protein